MKRGFFLFLTGLLVLSLEAEGPVAGNRYPIILVGGFMNFGRNEAVGFRYWGGFEDIQSFLGERGFTVFTADIGPLSSNWDRACELYAEIRGGTVDYGAHHAEMYSHRRFGRTCTGLYPRWGTPDPETGRPEKVHLVCHSMGGQTGRLLAHLLESGNMDEIEESGEGCSPLFTGGHRWIESVTTLATPHDGTTLTETVPVVEEYAVFLLSLLEAVNGITDEEFFTFQLEQWGLVREEGEGYRDFREKLKRTALWEETEDFSLFDLTPEGARALNERTPACEDIYYFSWATEETEYDAGKGKYSPEIGMNPGLIPGAVFLGSYSPGPGGPDWITPMWRWNDGVVNTPSMPGPRAGSSDRILSFDGNAKRGVWNYMGVLSSCDHLDIIGITTLPFLSPLNGYDSVKAWYLDLARFLWSLE